MKNHFLNLVVSICLVLLSSCSDDDRSVVDNDNPLEESETFQEEIIFEDFIGSVLENSIEGTIIGTVNTNNSLQNVNYKIDSQEPEGAIAINQSTGVLSVLDVTKFDFEAFQQILGNVSLTEGDQVTKILFTVSIENILDPTINIPELTDLFAFEDSLTGTELGIVEATTTEGTIAYSLTSQSIPNALTIESGTGIIKVNDGSAFDLAKASEITAEVIARVGAFSKSISFAVEVIDDTTSAGFTITELTNILEDCTWEITVGSNAIVFQPTGNLALNFSLHGEALWKVENTSVGARLFVQFGNGDNYDVYDVNEIDSETIEIVFVEKVGETVPIDFNYFGVNPTIWKKVCL